MRRAATFVVATLLSTTVNRYASAVDLPKVGAEPMKLDVTNVTVFGQRFNARTAEGEAPQDYGYGSLLDRLNLKLDWGRWTVGTRLDASFFWLRPEERTLSPDPQIQRNIVRDGATRYRNAVYPAKLWITYTAPHLAVTAGDAYAQFGRGLVLSLRKNDDLGVDTTVRGARIELRDDLFGLTLLAGMTNPSRVDEATGRVLFLPRPLPGDARGPLPVFGSDRLVGAEIVAGRGLPVVLSTHAVRLTRCAPYRYDEAGRIIDEGFASEFGSCAPNDTRTFLDSLPAGVNPTLNASEVVVAGQSIELPKIGRFGNAYVGVAVQRRRHDSDPNDPLAEGNAVYATHSGVFGPVTTTLELKSYRNFYPVAAAVDVTRAPAFSTVVYSLPPTAELVDQDSAFGFFNACVNGGRFRADVRRNEWLLLYGQAIYARTTSEITGGRCDKLGRIRSDAPAGAVTNDVYDGQLGMQLEWDGHRSHLYASAGGRDDTKTNGQPYYNEWYASYALSKWIAGPVSAELLGRHRLRKEETLNLRGPGATPKPFVQGESYASVKIAPKWALTQGFEYTTQLGQPTYYFNGSILYRFTADSNVRVFVGQQRGGLRCVSGICRLLPAYEGARVELTLRF